MLLKKIVIAEDDDAIAHMVNMALGDAGFLCLRARGGDEALNMVRMHTPDLLVLDVMMPGMDGLEVAKRLREDVILSKTPILMLTALGSVDNKVEGLEAGADDYLVKPFDLRELSARVKALIRASRRERDRNPTTSLPGSGSIDDHIGGILANAEVAGVIQFCVVGFDEYSDNVGFARAERLVADLGKMVLAEARAQTDESAFVGHLGGVDFVAVTDLAKAEALAGNIIDGFEAQRDSWTEGDEGDEVKSLVSAMQTAVAVVTTEGLEAEGGEELAVRLASAMRASKQGDGSNFVVWKPETA
jgi:DNA-binding response OmpR family regulator